MPLAQLLRPVAALSVLGLAFSACGDGGGLHESTGQTSSAITPIPGCDYSFARPTPASLVSMGYKFVARYLSGDPGSGKDITAAEATSLTGAGLDIILVWESTGTDATDGYNQGVSDATAAKSEAATVGQPTTLPIYFAIDFDAESSDSASINEYFQGVASVLGLSRTGVYGGYYIVNELFDAGLVDWGWQTYAWSSGQWDTRAQVRQTENGVDDDQLDDDEAEVASYGQWGPGASTAGPAYAAQFVSQSFPDATTALDMVEGQTIASYIEMKNVGTATWDSDTRLATTEPENRVSVFADSSWLAPDRPAAVTGTVPPGGTFKFKFNFHAPAKTGTWDEYFGMVQDGVAWFSAANQGGPPDNDLEAKIVVTAPAGGTGDGGSGSVKDAEALDVSPSDVIQPSDVEVLPPPGDAGFGDAGLSVDAGEPSGDGGVTLTSSSSAVGNGSSSSKKSGGGSGGHEEDAGEGDGVDAGAIASGNTGGCATAPGGGASSNGGLMLLGLAALVRRRRGVKA